MRLGIGLVALSLSACSSGEDMTAATAGIERFHNQLNGGQFEQIHDGADSEWRSVTTKQDAVKLFSAINRKLGRYESGKQQGWRVNYGTGGSTVVVQYDSKFQKADGVETFTFRTEGGRARLIGYNINSPVFMPE